MSQLTDVLGFIWVFCSDGGDSLLENEINSQLNINIKTSYNLFFF